MSFLRPKIMMPPPVSAPPPPPAVVTPEAVVRPTDVVDATKDNMTGEKAKKKSNQKTNVKTSAQGVMSEAPVQYASLLGASKRTKQPGD